MEAEVDRGIPKRPRQKRSRQKRPRQSEDDIHQKDIISTLPDSLLVHILSFLSMGDAVKTGTLSRRWDHLWTKVRHLYFDGPLSCRKQDQEKFVSFVYHTLSLLECDSIEEFLLNFYKSSPEVTNEEEEKEMATFYSHVDKWIRYTARKKVEVLHVNFFGNPSEGPLVGVPYKLPHHIFSNASITELMLSFCSIKPITPIQWNNLTSLFLYSLQLSDELIQNILSGSPLLEILRLSECTGMKHLISISTNLKSLAVCLRSGPCFGISAPHVQTLKISGDIEHYGLINVPSAVDVQVIPERQMTDSFPNILRQLLKSIDHARILSLSRICVQALSTLEVKDPPTSSFDCNILELNTSLTKWELPGIRLLLRTSPNLQTLNIQKVDECVGFYVDKELLPNFAFDEANYWNSMLAYPCMRTTLKNVEISDFTGGSSETALVEFLLKKSEVLQKLVIYSKKAEYVSEHSPFTSNDLFKFSQKLLSFQRASRDAVVLLS